MTRKSDKSHRGNKLIRITDLYGYTDKEKSLFLNVCRRKADFYIVYLMAKTKQQKESEIIAFKEKLQGAKSVIIASQDGLKVNEGRELRRACQAQNVKFVSIKKTLLKKVLHELGLAQADVAAMAGSLAVAISTEDEVAPAKILKEFAKKHEQVAFRGGILNGLVVSVDEVKKLADLPSKLELLAKMVGSMQAPIAGFVRVLSGNLRGLVTVLSAIKDKKQ